MQTLDLPRRRLALALAALAGFVDAAAYLSADQYFVSFMSGNMTRLGVELARRPVAALIPAMLALCFVLGVIGGAVLAAQAQGSHKPRLLAAVAMLLAVAAALGGVAWPLAALAVLAAAMGALNNSFQRDGQVSVGLTYMTGALVRMGQGLAARALGRDGAGWHHWLGLWLALACGATLGAFAQLHLAQAAFWLASIFAGLLALVARTLGAART